jgi:hypothetical protein
MTALMSTMELFSPIILKQAKSLLSAHVCPLLLGASCDPYLVLVTRYCHLLASSVS